MEERQFERAVAYFDRAIELDPADAEGWHGRGSARMILDRHAEALPDFDRVVELAPDSFAGHHGRGICLSVLGRCVEAVEAFDRSIALGPPRAVEHVSRGLALSQVRRHSDALADFQDAGRLEPNLSVARAYEALERVYLGEPDAALIQLEVALRANPNDVNALIVRAWVFQIVGRGVEGLDDMNRAVEGARGSEFARRCRASYLCSIGRVDEAVETFANCAESESNPNDVLWYGWALELRGRWDEARALYERVVDVDASLRRNIRGRIAYSRRATGDMEGAEEAARLAAEGDLVYIHDALGLALACAATDRPADALAALQHADEMEPHVRAPAAEYLRIEMLIRTGATEAAMGAAARLRERWPDHASSLQRCLTNWGLPEER